jgi:succinoglycan biosynthesis transport protein ExoP
MARPQAMPAARDPYASLGGYGAASPDGEPSLGQMLLEYWRIFYKRKWLVASIALAFLMIGSVRTLMITPLYTASARLQIESNVTKVVEGGNVTPIEGHSTDFLRTQYELLQSRTMAERVASALRLGDDADFFKPRQFSILTFIKTALKPTAEASPRVVDQTALERAAADIVMGNRAVRPVPGSRLVDVMYSDPNPARSQRIAQAYAEAFIASNLDKRFQANAYAKTFLEDQVSQLKIKLEASERAMLDFADKEQIVVITEKESIGQTNLAAANATLGNIITERIKSEQAWRQLEGLSLAQAINLPQLLTNKVIDGLRAQRNTLVTEYEEKLETFKPAYPEMQRISNKIKEIDRQIASEIKTIRDSLKAAYEAARDQESELKKRVEQLRTEVLDLQKRSIQYNILKREVDTTRELYNGLLQRYKEVDVAGGVGLNNIFVVDRAQLPGAPSSPQMSRALLISLALGLGAGLGAAYLLDKLDDTIRTSDEVERASGLVTLGVIPKIGRDADFMSELKDPRSGLSEAYRSLCTGLQFATESGLPKKLLITSAGPGEGKSSSALAVAQHFARMGLKVLLIDADLRNPSMHVKLGLPSGIGLSNYLTGACKPPDAFQRTDIANLWFMPSGPLPPNAADILAGSRMRALLTVGGEVFDFIVIDAPPVMGLADAPILASVAEALVFVVGANQAKLGQQSAGYGYGYGYGYEYGQGRVQERQSNASVVQLGQSKDPPARQPEPS